MRRYRIEFDHLPKAVNLNSQVHWAIRAKHAKDSHAAVKAAVEQQGIQLPLEPLKKVHVCSHFYLPTMNPRDLEQCRANIKHYIDALCVPVYWKDGRLKRDGIGLIVDDKMTCLYSECQSWELRRNTPGFYIWIQELPDA